MNKQPSQTTGMSENMTDATGRSQIAFGLQRFKSEVHNSTDSIWRFRIGAYCSDRDFKFDVDATPAMLRKMARWCERAAKVIETDGVDLKETTP